MRLPKQVIKCVQWLGNKLKVSKEYENLSDMPSRLIVLFGVPCSLISLYFIYQLQKVLPRYINAVNATPIWMWGVRGWIVTIVIAIIAVLAWHYGRIAQRCNKILYERWYK